MRPVPTLLAAGVAAVLMVPPANADETDARRILQSMSDYMSGLEAFAFDYTSMHEIVTTEGEKLGLARSGTVAIARPNRVRASSRSGFTDLEMAFDGATFAMSDGDSALFAELPITADLDFLVDALRDTHGRPLPAADLVVADPFSILIEGATSVKDLGSGVVGGVDCDHLAVRGPEVDWQIWIAQGETPHPCLFVITSREVNKAPQYSVTVREWRETTGDTPFALTPEDGTSRVDIETFAKAAPSYPDHFMLEADQ